MRIPAFLPPSEQLAYNRRAGEAAERVGAAWPSEPFAPGGPRREAIVTRSASAVILDAVARLHERGLQGVRIRANFYATGHWRCRVYVSRPGDDPSMERDVLVAYTSGRENDLLGDGRGDWTDESFADELGARAAGLSDAARPDPAYVSWYHELREATGPDGVFALWDDDDDWERAGQVAVLRGHGDPRARRDFLPLPPPP